MPEELRERFEETMISSGKLLPSKQGRRLQPEQDEFAVAAAEFLQKTHRDEDHAVPPTILDVLLPGPATTEPQQKKPRKRQATKPASEE